MKTLSLLRRSSTIAASLALMTHSPAAKTWQGNTDGNWATTTNWLEGALPGTTETVVFDTNSTSNLTINAGANRTIRGINFSAPAGNVTVNNNAVIIGTGGIDMSTATADLTINSPITILSGQQHWNVAADRTFTTSAVPLRNTGATNANVGGTLNVSATGTIKMGAAALANIVDTGGGNPFVTIGLDDWAATDATGKVIPVTYTVIGTGTNAVVNGAHNDIQGNATMGNSSTPNSLRFSNTGGPATLAATNTTHTIRGVLMTSGSMGGSITGGFVRPNRSSTAGASMSIIQNSTLGDLTISSAIPSASSSTPVSIVKSGVGKVIFTGSLAMNGTTVQGQIFINEGAVQLGDGTNAGALQSTGNVYNNGSLIVNRSDIVSWSNVISGTGNLIKRGTGSLTLTGNSTFTGPTILEGGIFNFTALTNFGSGTALTFNGGTLTHATGVTTDLSGVKTIDISNGGGTIDTNGNDVTWASPVGNGGIGGLAKIGAGKLTLSAANTYTGVTFINGGSIHLTGSLGGGVTINNNASLTGTGTVNGLMTVASGGIVSPGTNGVGNLTSNALTLESGAVVNVEFGGGNDQLSVTNADGLTLTGGGFHLYQTGTTTAFATNGTYNLIAYTGTLNGATTNLNVLNPQPGKNYVFGSTGSFVTLTISNASVISDWNVDASGSWGDSAKWTAGTIPNGSGQAANFTFALTNPQTITLDGNRTLGGLAFSGTAGYILAEGTGGVLNLDNGLAQANIVATSGNHQVLPNVALASTTVFNIAASSSITFSGVVSGIGGVIKTGDGLVNLTGNNTYSGGTTISGGTISFSQANSLGISAVTLNGGTLKYNPGNTADISPLGIACGVNGATIDTNGNDVLFLSAIGNNGVGAFTKAGAGALTLVGSNTYLGATTVTGGQLILQGSNLSNGLILAGDGASVKTSSEAGLGLSTGHITFNAGAGKSASLIADGPITLAAPRNVQLTSGTAVIDTLVNTLTISAPLSGVGGLEKRGSGTLIITGTNQIAATGPITVEEGTLQANGGALPAGTLALNGTSTLSLGASNLANPLLVNGANTLLSGDNGGQSGLNTVAGNGSLDVNITGANVDLRGNLAAFAGTLKIVSPGGTFRINGSTGSTQTTFDLGVGGAINVRSTAAAIELGALQGATGTFLSGNTSSATTLIYSIGGKNINSAFDGTISNSGFAGASTGINKVGTGILTLGGNSTYSGTTTVSSGTLLVYGDNSAATGAVSVNSGATLGGTGRVGGATLVASGGILSPGASIGAFATGNLTIEGKLLIELDQSSVSKSDKLAVTGDIGLGVGSILTLTNIGTPLTDNAVIIATYTGNETGTFGTVENLPQGYRVEYAYNDGVTTKNIALVKFNGYDSWAGDKGLTGPSAAALADPDQDGIQNLLEFVLDGDPSTPAQSILPTQTIAGGNLTFTFTRRDDSEAEVTLIVQHGSDLDSWTDVPIGPASAGIVTVEENGVAPDVVTVTIPLGTAARKFARLKASK